MFRSIALSFVLAGTVLASSAQAATVKLPAMADKGLYCHEVLIEAAKQLNAAGDVASARALRYYAQNWTTWVRSARSSDVNKVRAQYTAEAKKDVARKKYRYKDCGAVLN
jgi:hypothetical protein